jgi:hypothetical protein
MSEPQRVMMIMMDYDGAASIMVIGRIQWLGDLSDSRLECWNEGYVNPRSA